MLLFSTHITPRLSYIVEFISKELFDEHAQIVLTTDREVFIAAPGPRINYSTQQIPGCFTLRPAITPAAPPAPPAALLFESGIYPIAIECILCNDQKAFFPTEGDLPFDHFGSFLLSLSRYEEYLPIQKMNTAALPTPIHSPGGKAFLDQPLINGWLQEFKNAIIASLPRPCLPLNPVFKFIPTYDIDTAWSYRYKGWRRNMGGII
jgi:hypothetical protein